MNRTIITILIAAIAASALAGCEDGKRAADEQLSESAGVQAKVISRADIAEALWNTEKEPAPDTACVTTSKFTFDRANPLMIKKGSGRPTEISTTSVIIVGPINLLIPAKSDKEDVRGEQCPDGELKYLLTASDEMPVDILLAKDLTYTHSLDAVARDRASPYPDNCRITAHFEKHGEGECATGSAWVGTEEKKAAAKISSPGTADVVGAGEADDDVDDAGDDAQLPSATQVQLSAFGECIEPEVPIFVIVVDGYDCTSKPFKR